MARRRIRKSNKTTYGKTFTTKAGKRGRYKYVNGRRVSFVRVAQTWSPSGKKFANAYVTKSKKRVRR